MNRTEILNKAKLAVEQREVYGSPLANFTAAAKLWSVILDADVRPFHVALCLDALKTARILGKPHDEDSWVDKAGYAACGAEVV